MITDDEKGLYAELRSIVARLRAPDGCPWDREQTHASLRPYLLQETYEALATLDDGDTARLPEELGDVLFQVLLHSQLAEEAGEFSMSDILSGLAAKLVRRHPHVFGEDGGAAPEERRLGSSSAVIDQWDALKKRERETTASALSGIPDVLPALAQAQETTRRAGAAGFKWPSTEGVLAKIAEEAGELEVATTPEAKAEELGDLLLSIATYARYLDIDAEDALRAATRKFRRRFMAVESLARERGDKLPDMTTEALLDIWALVKDEDR